MRLTPILLRTIKRAGLSALITSRADYVRFRGPKADIATYISKATRELKVVGITFMTGLQIDDTLEVLRELVTRMPVPVKVTISLLNPSFTPALQAIAPVLNKTPLELQNDIASSLRLLAELRGQLSPQARRNLILKVHSCLPAGSVIMIDPELPGGTFQLETKVYKAPYSRSFGFELKRNNQSAFYKTLVDGFNYLINDAKMFGPSKHLPKRP